MSDDRAVQRTCLDLLSADSEEEVVQILQRAGYWDDANMWRLFGDRENNFSTIGNQQSRPEAALIEKVVNAIDARLMNECIARGIRPDSPAAPPSIRQAVARFYEAKNTHDTSGGTVQGWSTKHRREESKGITIAVTGAKRRPCVTIADTGEGQSPSQMPNTFLSIDRSNKLRIPFVQGKFNMGGTGVLQFCGQRNIQLIVTRRNPALASASTAQDDSDRKWAFTVVRRETGQGGVKNSVYTYLAPVGARSSPRHGEVLRFVAPAMPLMPDGNSPYTRNIEWGSAIKLYEYDMKGFASHALMPDGLLGRLEAMLPEPALPIRVHECRDYKGHAGSFETTLVGLSVRLDDNKGDNLESGFPDSIPFKVEGECMTAKIYAFTSAKKAGTYRTNEGIIFTINGQTHGAIPRTIFSRDSVKMGRLADSLLVTIDCSNISIRAREDLFMNSRDRLRSSELRKALEGQLEEILQQHAGLRELRERRQREEREKRLEGSKPLEEILETLLKSSPSLSALFLPGNRISRPFKQARTRGKNGQGDHGGEGDAEFEGKTHPTYFRFPKTPYGQVYHRGFEIGRRCRLSFETDVVNDYFARTSYPGRFCVEVLEPSDMEEPNWSLTLHDGVAALSLELPEDVIVGEHVTVQFTVEDDVIAEPFVSVAELMAHVRSEHPSGGPTRPRGKGTGGNSNGPAGISLPDIQPVKEADWAQHNFDRYSACKIVQDVDAQNGEQIVYTFYVNIDNVHLQSEVKSSNDDPRLARTKFIFGNVLVGLALIQSYREREQRLSQADAATEESGQSGQNGFPAELTIEEYVKATTKALAPFMLPMIDQLGSISEDEVAALGVVGDDE